MNKNILHRLFTVLLCLAAVISGCQTSLPFFPTATPTITASPTLTKTATPAPTLAPTKAPTASPTREATATPAVPEYRHGLATQSADFTLLHSDEEEAAVTRDVMNSTLVDINQDPMLISRLVGHAGGYDYIQFQCHPGVNCVVGASIARTITLPDGSSKVIQKLIWQGVETENGVKKLITFKTNNAFFTLLAPSTVEDDQYQALSTAVKFDGKLALALDPQVTNPVAIYVFNHEDPAIVQSLRDGILPDNLAETTFWLFSFSAYQEPKAP